MVFRQVGAACGTRIILDESLTRREQLGDLDELGSWLLNLRVSKLGGLQRALEVAADAAERGLAVIVGAQVGETSLLTRAGLTVMNAAHSNLTAAEGAFGTRLLRRDLTSECLMFGHAGALDARALADRPGLGLQIHAQSLAPISA